LKKISKRREKVVACLRKGVSETKIAEILDVSRGTIVRDVKHLKDSSQTWLDGIAKGGFIFEYKTGLDNIKESRNKLEKLYKESSDIEQKRRIIKSLDDNEKLYLQILGEAPTIHAFRKVIQGNQKNV